MRLPLILTALVGLTCSAHDGHGYFDREGRAWEKAERKAELAREKAERRADMEWRKQDRALAKARRVQDKADRDAQRAWEKTWRKYDRWR